jgi:hypothetical protein
MQIKGITLNKWKYSVVWKKEKNAYIYTGVLEVIVLVILSKNVYMYMCHITNGFRDRVISLYSSKIVSKKEI